MFPRQRTGRSLRAAEARNSHSLVVPPQSAALCKTVRLILWPEPAEPKQAQRSCRPTPGVAPACPLTRKFSLNRRFKCMSVADGRLFFLHPLVPRRHLLFCATKKASKEPAGNAIPRSRLPSEREIAHSRVCSLYPYFDTNIRSRGYFVKTTVLWPEPAEPKQAQRSCRPAPGVAPA